MSRARRIVEISTDERQELVRVRDTHPKAYVRERAAAVLKVADGMSMRQVAFRGLLKRRSKDAIHGWIVRYETEGVQGLVVRSGRGRKAAHFP